MNLDEAAAAIRSSVTIVDVLLRAGIARPKEHELIAPTAVGLPGASGATGADWLEISPGNRERSWQTADGRLGGDVIDLVRAITGAGLQEALALLSLGGPIITTRGGEDPVSKAHSQARDELPTLTRTPAERVLVVNEAVWTFYTDVAPAARARARLVDWGVIPVGLGLLERDAGRPTAGHTPLSPTGLVDHLRHEGFDDDEVIDAGWAVREPGSLRLADRYRNRVLLPYCVRRPGSGPPSVVGASGRSISWAPGAEHRHILDHERTVVFHAPDAAHLPAPGEQMADVVVVAPTAIDALAVTAAASAAGMTELFAAVHVPAAAPGQAGAALVAGSASEALLVRGGRAPQSPDVSRWQSAMSVHGRSATAMTLPGGLGPLDWLRSQGVLGLLAFEAPGTSSRRTARHIGHDRPV